MIFCIREVIKCCFSMSYLVIERVYGEVFRRAVLGDDHERICLESIS